jgi:TRAP-type C4-dicarboxylate transport system permease small subunit
MMGKIVGILEKINGKIKRFIEFIIFMIFAFLIVIVTTNVVLRYIFKSPLFWVTELSCYCLVYLVFLGATLALYKGEHVQINLNTNKIPNIVSKIFYCISVSLNFVFIGLVVYWGVNLAFSNMKSYTGSLPIPMGCVYLAAPICGLLMIPLYLEKVIKKGEKK